MNNINNTSVTVLSTGLRSKCPRCGVGKLYKNFIQLDDECSNCKLDYSFADSGDGPAVFIILIVGFIVVGGALYVELAYRPAYWVHALIWLPLTLFLVLSLLRPLKSLLIASQYKNKAEEGKLE